MNTQRISSISTFAGLVLGVTLTTPVMADSLDGHVLLQTRSLSGTVPVQTWKARRDARSIATVLSEYYRRPTTEKEVLDLLLTVNDKKGRASFADMQAIMPELGFKAVGLATNWEQLLDLKIPVIVYVLHRKQDHFTVVSGINKHRIKVSDPSLGNRIYTRGQFLRMWNTRDQAGLEGRMFACTNRNIDDTCWRLVINYNRTYALTVR